MARASISPFREGSQRAYWTAHLLADGRIEEAFRSSPEPHTIWVWRARYYCQHRKAEGDEREVVSYYTSNDVADGMEGRRLRNGSRVR